MQDLGERLKALRKSRGLTQKQLGEQIHKSKAAIGSYEQGVQIPPTDVLISLAKLYHLSLDDLVGLNEPQPRAYLKTQTSYINCTKSKSAVE